MILTDREIKIAIARKLIRIDPAPDHDVALTSTALDLTLDPQIRVFKDNVPGVVPVIDPSVPGFNSADVIGQLTDKRKIPFAGYELPPNKLILAWTREYVELSVVTRIAARVEGRSSLARLGLGVHVTAPTIHAGFKGPIQLEMINHGISPILLKPGMRICQLIFETTLGTPEKGYTGQFLNQTKLVHA
ncbi:MAG: dCTP deaminase [Alphaproteobacteria bacterium]|nr:dCTP deaminase [Alphaproteobacteria bacterium]MBV9694806.1 dCTP deaminase [Alphaproteobacteria bacterium]